MISVVKLGGSLLDLPDLGTRWNRFIEVEKISRPTLVVAGGGDIVQGLRRYDAIHHLDQRQTHWLAVDLMSATAHLLSEILANTPLLLNSAQLEDWIAESSSGSARGLNQRTAIVAPSAFYTRELRSDLLPPSWETTSDAIAAMLATIVGAEQLILLKSTESDLDDVPLIDQTFRALFAETINWRCVNLRSQRYD